MKSVDYISIVSVSVFICLIVTLPIIFTRPTVVKYMFDVDVKDNLESQGMRTSQTKPPKARYHKTTRAKTTEVAQNSKVACTTDTVTCKLDCADEACSGQCVQCFTPSDCASQPFSVNGYTCTDNKCVKVPCFSDCKTKPRQCGADNCGDSCGTTCASNQYCNQDGQCDTISKVTVDSWFTQELYDKIAPYAGISAIYTDDGQPLYTYQGFIDALKFMETLPNPMYHGFAASSSEDNNKKELAAFFGNAAEETGTGFTGPQVPSITCKPADTPGGQTQSCGGKWLANCANSNDCLVTGMNCNMECTTGGKCMCAGGIDVNWNAPGGYLCGGGPPPPDPTDPDTPPAEPVDRNGSFGTGVAAIEGVLPVFDAANGSCGSFYTVPITSQAVKDRLGSGGCTNLCLQNKLLPSPNKARGLFDGQTGTQDGGCFFNNGTEGGFGNYACVSSNGTLMQGNPSSIKITNPDTRDLFKFRTFDPKKLCTAGDTSCSCLKNDMSCQYVGRGPSQLTGGANYTDCSQAFFGDLRLVRWPNLLTTVNRADPLNPNSAFLKNCGGTKEICESVLSFPGGALPDIIIKTTPPARVLIWASTLFFWMDRYRIGFNGVSCHDAMVDPLGMGIQCVNLIVNANSCSDVGNIKSFYYQAICRALGVKPDKDVCPQDELIKKCAKGEGGGSNKCPSFATGGNPSDCWDPTGAFTQDGGSCCCPYQQAPDKADAPTQCLNVTDNRYNCDSASKAGVLTNAGEKGTYMTANVCNFACDPPIEKCKLMCPAGCLFANGQCHTSDAKGEVTKAMCDGWEGYWCPAPSPGPPGPAPGPAGSCVPGSSESGGGACDQSTAQYTSGNLTCCCDWGKKIDDPLKPTKCIYI